ncbi:uncharacterized protein B4U80_13177 [Leptotrombidium deliense]|uniref:Zinc finger CCHC domain-containing protein 7 n=1 Tax=Leptotrombidium deliense TaxID=299467 RepID=A0A443SB54_9ACAR|nr:uncharacterized protein B4U80_13177 [Leptotrombidium deliense]
MEKNNSETQKVDFKLSNVKGKNRGLSTLLPKKTMSYFNSESEDSSSEQNLSSLSADILESIPGDDRGFKRIKRSPGEDPKLWKLDIMDLRGGTRSRYYSRLKYCNRCQKYGNHPTKLCNLPSGVTVCSLCGASGHHSFSCKSQPCDSCWNIGHNPNRCPNRKTSYICSICGTKGHTDDLCPNHWRKLCNTTSLNDTNTTSTTKKNKQKYCANCGGHHFSFDCHFIRNYFYTPFPVTPQTKAKNEIDAETMKLMKFADNTRKQKGLKKKKPKKKTPKNGDVASVSFTGFKVSAYDGPTKTGKRGRSAAATDRWKAKKAAKRKRARLAASHGNTI